MSDGLRVAVAGATGAVGLQMLRCLERRQFPVTELIALASPRSVGRTVPFAGGAVPVAVLSDDSFEGVDLALFSVGAGPSRRYAPRAAQAGAVVVDNSSAWRMDESVPLVVPEVNADALGTLGGYGDGRGGIIANPNCSTIQLVLALAPLHEAAGLRRVVVSTYQSASGAGQSAVDALFAQSRAALDPAANAENAADGPFPTTLAFNCIPQIDVFLDDGATKEEWKMVVESRKILGLPELRLHATCVRIPVERGHSEAVNIEFERPLTPDAARAILASAPGIQVLDDPATGTYPTPLQTADTDETYIGRIRRDDTVEHGLSLWVVSDNLLKGAALNAVQIAEAVFETR